MTTMPSSNPRSSLPRYALGSLCWALLTGMVLALCLFCGCELEVVPADYPSPEDHGPVPQRPCPDGRCPYATIPPMDLPEVLRQHNYAGGSCVHASLVSVLRWQNLPELAAWWREAYRGGETLGGLVAKVDAARLRFAYTDRGNTEFLAWCSRTRRGAVVFYKPAHAVCFCGFVGRHAVVMDNNHPARLEWIPRETFLARWQAYGGVALTAVYSPAPPRPWVARMTKAQ